MRPNPVQKLMIDLGAGRVTLDDAVDQLPGLLKPARVRNVPKSDIMTDLGRNYDGDHPYTPESWDDVSRAYVSHGTITTDQYRALRKVTIPRAEAVHD